MTWRLDIAFPFLASMKSSLPWSLAPFIGRDSWGERRSLLNYLAKQMARCFPMQDPLQIQDWAIKHLDMLALEMVDSLAFHRLGRCHGPRIELFGLETAMPLEGSVRGTILVLNHVDRLLAGPIALSRNGIASNVLTMPVFNNSEITDAHRRFLLKKISLYTQETGGVWYTTDKGIRHVYESLCQGATWVILADAWRPEFGRLSAHEFLNGQLYIPTGIERLAQSTGARLLHVHTETVKANHMNVFIDVLPSDPFLAVSQVIRQLESDIVKRPWAWWQWGMLDSMWKPHLKDAQ